MSQSSPPYEPRIMTKQTMKAVTYQGPFKVQVQEVEKPALEHPDDIVVKITTVGSHGLVSKLLASMNFVTLTALRSLPYAARISSKTRQSILEVFKRTCLL